MPLTMGPTGSHSPASLVGVRWGRAGICGHWLLTRPRSAHYGGDRCAEGGDCLWVALTHVRVLFLCAKHLFFSAKARRQARPSDAPGEANGVRAGPRLAGIVDDGLAVLAGGRGQKGRLRSTAVVF